MLRSKQNFNLHKDFLILPERKKIEKFNRLIYNIHDQENHVDHIRPLKQALNRGLILKKVHRVNQFNQEAWLKPYINMNTELTKKAKNELEKDFFKLMINYLFGETMENARNYRDIILVTEHRRKNQLVSESNYHTLKYCSENLMPIKMKKTKVKMSKPFYLSMSILDISKSLMREIWYDYIKPKYGDRANLCYTNT